MACHRECCHSTKPLRRCCLRFCPAVEAPGKVKREYLNLPKKENEPAPFTKLAPEFTGAGMEFSLASRRRS